MKELYEILFTIWDELFEEFREEETVRVEAENAREAVWFGRSMLCAEGRNCDLELDAFHAAKVFKIPGGELVVNASSVIE